MYDPRSIANEVSRWTSLGVKLPKELAEAVTVFESLVYTEVGYQPVFDIAEVTATNAEALIKEFADQLVLAEAPGGGASPLQKAKKIAVEAAARRVNSLARVAVTDVIEQLTSEFNQHAEAYIAAVKKLGPGVPLGLDNSHLFNLTPENLVAWGPDAVVAYSQARQEAVYLNKISSWVASTSRLTGGDTEVVLRILRPANVLELRDLDAAHYKTATQTVLAVDPVLYTAAHRGVEFGINTAAESVAIRTSLEQAAVKSLSWK